MALRKPFFSLTYEGTDISRDLARFPLSLTFTDFLSGNSDTLSLDLQDEDAQWIGPWYPFKGDTIQLAFGYEGEELMAAGGFRVDEITADGPPHKVTISALAAPITAEIRTKRSEAYENMTLAQIADRIAGRHGMSVVGNPSGGAAQRITQRDESDAAFLDRLAEEQGLAFTIRDARLVFEELTALEQAGPLTRLTRGDLIRYSLSDRTRKTYSAARVSYQDPQSGKTLEHTEQAADGVTGDTLVIRERVETKGQARDLAKRRLLQANRLLARGSVTVSGTPTLIAGSILELSDMGRLSGNYLIEQSSHRIDTQGGFVSDAEVRLVR